MNIEHNNPTVPPGDWLLKLLTAKKFSLLRHIGALLMSLLLILNAKRWGQYSGVFDHLDWLLTFIMLTSIFYINIYILIPRLFYIGKAARYILILALAIAVGMLVLVFAHELFLSKYRLLPEDNSKGVIFSVIPAIILLTPFYLVSTAFKLFQRWVADTRRLGELEMRALHSELKALRKSNTAAFSIQHAKWYSRYK